MAVRQQRVDVNARQKPNHSFWDADRWELIAEYMLQASIAILLSRVIFTFIFAWIFGQSWHIQRMWGILPVIVFNSDPEIFTKLNSYSMVSTGVILFMAFLIVAMKRKSLEIRDFLAKLHLWYLGVVLTVIQYVIALWINKYVQFSINPQIGYPMVGLALVATLIYVYTIVQIRQHSSNLQSQERSN